MIGEACEYLLPFKLTKVKISFLLQSFHRELHLEDLGGEGVNSFCIFRKQRGQHDNWRAICKAWQILGLKLFLPFLTHCELQVASEAFLSK